MRLRHVLPAMVIAATLSGCCALMPCHPATSLTGELKALDGTPVAAGQIMLYGTPVRIDANGCFKVHFADALPFTLVARAPGYKPVEVRARAGFHRAKVSLAPELSPEASRTEWSAISPTDFEAFSCP